jgi:hypothetical protein
MTYTVPIRLAIALELLSNGLAESIDESFSMAQRLINKEAKLQQEEEAEEEDEDEDEDEDCADGEEPTELY